MSKSTKVYAPKSYSLFRRMQLGTIDEILWASAVEAASLMKNSLNSLSSKLKVVDTHRDST